MSVWDDLVGQQDLVRQLTDVAAAAAATIRGEHATGMTHAYLFTGPPGSGRSTAARAFAAALQCPDAGCRHCEACHTVLAGTHADVEFVVTELLTIGVNDTRDLVRRAALSPAGRRWQVIVMEDVDRLTERAANVLLKSIEEPAKRTVWMLCAPSLEDVLPTIRSRCRHLLLRTPPTDAVAEVLIRRDGVDPGMAAFAARAAQGHIGRAKRLAQDERSRERRAEVMRLPTSLSSVGSALGAAQRLVDAATAEAKQATEEVNARETEQMRTALGAGGTGKGMPAGSAGVLKDLESRQKKRATRRLRDSLDRAMVDLASFYRDVLVTQFGAAVELTNDELRSQVSALAAADPPELTLRRIDAVLACRQAIATSVAPLLAVEAMTLALRQPLSRPLGHPSARIGG